MAALSLPKEVADHLAAAIQLSSRRLQLRLLEEAEALIAMKLPVAAILIAGAILDSIFGEPATPEERQQGEQWIDLRHRASHAPEPSVTVDQARQMVNWVRRQLTRSPATETGAENGPRAGKVQKVRGKYKYVETSSADFIRRKADELALENHERCS